MTAKQYLSRYKWLVETIPDLEEEYRTTLEAATSISVPTDGEKVSSSTLSDKTANAAIDLAEISQRIRERKAEAQRIRWDIAWELEKLEPHSEYYKVISKRWLQLKSWNEIADEMGYSVRQVQRIHGDALAALNRML